jgi:hypothetical protein
MPSHTFRPSKHLPAWSPYDPKSNVPNFETLEDVQRRNLEFAHILSQGSRNQQHLAQKLLHCGPDETEVSGASPVSMYNLRRLHPIMGMEFLDNELTGMTYQSAISIIPPQSRVEIGSLRDFNDRSLRNRIRRAFSSTELHDVPFVGGFDISYNEHANGDWPPYWQLHLYLLTIYPPEDIHDELRAAFRGDDETPRPVQVKQVDTPLSALTYSLKSTFVRRISYVGRNGRHNTRKTLPIRPKHLRELLEYLDRLGMTGRLFLLNVRRRGGRFTLA